MIKKNSIFINPDNLDAIIDTLMLYKEDISKNQKIGDKYFINDVDKKTIIATFLKGITVNDLCLQSDYQEYKIQDLLLENDIEIIEGIDIKPTLYRFDKYRKK